MPCQRRLTISTIELTVVRSTGKESAEARPAAVAIVGCHRYRDSAVVPNIMRPMSRRLTSCISADIVTVVRK